MEDGIYFVVFKSAHNDVGAGTVVVRNHTVNGGDYGFTYQGIIQNGVLDLLVTQHDPQAQSVLPDLHEYRATFTVRQSPNGYLLQGNIPGTDNASLTLHAKFIGQLI